MSPEEEIEFAFAAGLCRGFELSGEQLIDRDEQWQIFKMRRFGTSRLDWKLNEDSQSRA